VDKGKHGGRTHSGWLDAGYLLGDGVQLIFTDRSGGFSPPPYDTLNLSGKSGDDQENVEANRDYVAGRMGLETSRFVYLEQVHGISVKRVEARSLREGREAKSKYTTLAKADGAYTTHKDIALCVLTADCVPLALAGKGGEVVAMLHSGWRGTIGDIAGRAVRKMSSEIGIDAGSLVAVMGPAIGPCCYEVDEGRARIFVEKYGGRSEVVVRKGGYRLDLVAANRINLIEAGLKEKNIRILDECTCCNDRYFSFRRDGVTGRQGAFIRAKG
jgi:YfiH family protein